MDAKGTQSKNFSSMIQLVNPYSDTPLTSQLKHSPALEPSASNQGSERRNHFSSIRSSATQEILSNAGSKRQIRTGGFQTLG